LRRKRGTLARQRLIFTLFSGAGLGKKPGKKTRKLMPSKTYIAETNLQGHVIAVWIQENNKRPRTLRPTEATLASLDHAKFSGASKAAIVAWILAAIEAQKSGFD
jgi:hypothetical protein